MKSKNARRESCKRRMDFDDDLETSHTDSSKKRKFSDSDHDFESKKSKDDLSSPLRNPRVLRSSGLLTGMCTDNALARLSKCNFLANFFII